MGAKSDQVKGQVKDAAGSLTGDKDLESEGRADRRAGEAKEKVDHGPPSSRPEPKPTTVTPSTSSSPFASTPRKKRTTTATVGSCTTCSETSPDLGPAPTEDGAPIEGAARREASRP